MEQRGLLRREDCATDNRGAEVSLTESGAAAFRRASAPHLRAIKQHFVDALTPEQIELITQVLSPGAEPQWAADAVREADIVVLALPLHRFTTLDPALLAGKLVVDAMNYWPPVDGVQELFEDHP